MKDIYGDCNIQLTIHLHGNYRMFKSSAKAHWVNRILPQEIWTYLVKTLLLQGDLEITLIIFVAVVREYNPL